MVPKVLKAGVLATGLVLLGWLWWSGEDPEPPPGESRAAVAPGERSRALPERSRPVEPPLGRVPAGPQGIFGVVRDAYTNEPVAGARLEVGGLELESGGNGAYRIETLPPGEHRLSVYSDHHVLMRVSVHVEESRMRASDVLLEPQLAVACAGTDGRAVRDADVFALEGAGGTGDGGAGTSYGPVSTGEDGIARFLELEHFRQPPRARRFYAFSERGLAGFGSVRSRPRDPAVPYPITVFMHPTLEVAGRVVVPSGFDPREVTVRVARAGMRGAGEENHGFSHRGGRDRGAWGSRFRVRPDARGNFDIPGILAGCSIEVVADGEGLARHGISSGNPAVLRAIVPELVAEAAMAGTLHNAVTGEAAVGVHLIASSRNYDDFGDVSTRVVADGTFEFRGLAPGAYVVTLPWQFGGVEWTMRVAGPILVSSAEIAAAGELFLERGAGASGAVRDASTLEPIPGVTVVARSGPALMTSVAKATSGDDGSYHFRLPPGRVSLAIDPGSVPAGYKVPPPGAASVLTLGDPPMPAEGTELAEPIDFELAPVRAGESPVLPGEQERLPATRIRGRVVDRDGAPLEGAIVTVFVGAEAPEIAGSGYTDSFGAYEHTVALDDLVRVRAGGRRFSEGWSPELRIVSVPVQLVPDIALRVGSARISGVATDPAGRPIHGLVLGALSESKSLQNVETDGAGRFVIQHLLPDEIVRISVQTPAVEFRDFLVFPGADVKLRFHSIQDASTQSVGEKVRVKDSRSLVGELAPDWDVAEWVQRPEVPGPRASGGRSIVLVSTWLPDTLSRLDRFFDGIAALEERCRAARAIPVLIVSHQAHSSIVVPQVRRRGLTLGIGIDRFVPRAESSYADSNSATLAAYGRGTWPQLFAIDDAGVVREVRSAWDLQAESVPRQENQPRHGRR